MSPLILCPCGWTSDVLLFSIFEIHSQEVFIVSSDCETLARIPKTKELESKLQLLI